MHILSIKSLNYSVHQRTTMYSHTHITLQHELSSVWFFLLSDHILMIDENIKKVKFYLNFCSKRPKVC